MSRISHPSTSPVRIAILAVGGQGGGVVTNWLVQMAEAQGWIAQSTSVPGVAQRTGATIYYVEMIRPAGDERKPVLGLMPTPGSVDLVVAAEWMEAGRAVQRGLVTPDRTTLIASTHRMLSVAEKSVPGDGVSSPEIVELAANAMSKRFHKADLAAIATNCDSVVSASIFGAVAGSGCLPFDRAAFQEAVRQGGIGVENSLAAFDEACESITRNASPDAGKATDDKAGELSGGTPQQRAAYAKLRNRVDRVFSPETRRMVLPGLNRVIDFQDFEYGEEYVDLLEPFHKEDRTEDHALTSALAKHLANSMAYHDVIRVADLKTRRARFERLKTEIRHIAHEPVCVTDYFHPRREEMASLLPVGMAARAGGGWIAHMLDRLSGARRIRSNTIIGFCQLYLLSGLKRWRRKLARHATEMRHVRDWLALVRKAASHNQDLAVEIANCRRLIKGYGDTHARGMSKYDLVLAGIVKIERRPDAAEWTNRLIGAALADAEGDALTGMLKTLDELETVPAGAAQ